MNSKINHVVSGFIFIYFFIGITTTIYPQDLKFKLYGLEEGICHPFIYTINQDKNGFIWAGTGEGLCKYDGFNFSNYQGQDSVSESFTTVSFKDGNGNLWLGNNFGGIQVYDGAKFKKITSDEKASSTINDIVSDSKGNIFFATQNNGIFKISNQSVAGIFQGEFNNQLLYSIALTGQDELLAGTGTGLYLYSMMDEAPYVKLVENISNVPLTKIQCIVRSKRENVFWVGTEDDGFYRVKRIAEKQFEVINEGVKYGLERANVQSILEDTDKNLWISTFGDGLFKLTYVDDNEFKVMQYVKEHGLGTLFIKSTFRDKEGNIWVATYGKGLALLMNTSFSIWFQNNDIMGESIYSVYSGRNFYWMGGKGVLAKVDISDNKQVLYLTKNNGLPDDKITALYKDSKENLWIGTESNGLYRFVENSNTAIQYHFVGNSLGNSIKSITEAAGKLWIATNNGIFSFELGSGKKTHYNTNTGLPHNRINHLFSDSKGQVWISTKSNGVLTIEGNQKRNVPEIVELEFTSVAEDEDGNIWAATYGDGVFKFEKDTFYHIQVKDGLKSNFCYCIISDGHNGIWVGHRLGLSKITVSGLMVKTFSKETGITGDCNLNAVSLQTGGYLLFGTTNGLIQCDLSKERKNTTPPATNITSVRIGDELVDFSGNIVKPYGVYKLKIDFIGLSYSDPERVTYQYKLDGYDLDWSDVSFLKGATYNRIEDGEFTFLLKSCNAEGVCNEQPLALNITIRRPVWKTWWFITLSALVIIGAVYLIIKAREKKQKKLQDYLEKELAERTKEVVKQKEELIIKNRDITDSINYAQRIQASILPASSRLESNFSGSFVFYQPRDIVSGDFYWYEKVSENKFIIICSDSTGHGVPGAFMSMIGTTLIKDITRREGVESPSDVLRILDSELSATLNQSLGTDKSNDGMDIIVCEINTDNYYVRLASAMRPIIVYQNKELIYVKGSRSSIGGKYEDKKDFEVKGFQLGKGDIIYMFSDGYSDQFGGPLGKKYKMVRLKNLLSDVCELSMEEQEKAVENAFNKWKGQYKQVDDVLFMGIQI